MRIRFLLHEGSFPERSFAGVHPTLANSHGLTPLPSTTVTRMNTTIFNIIGVYVGWFACVVGAAQGLPWIGPAVVLLLLVGHCRLVPHVAQELRLLFTVGALGFALDTLLAALGLFSFSGSSGVAWISPPWMVALWMNFATTLHTSLSWLSGRYLLAALLGAAGGPLSYYAGAQLGALILHANVTLSILTVAAVWGGAAPLLVWLANDRK